MTLEKTPANVNNILYITITAILAFNNNVHVQGALFQDSTVNALAACSALVPAADGVVILHMTHKMTAGTISATTFKFRAGTK